MPRARSGQRPPRRSARREERREPSTAAMSPSTVAPPVCTSSVTDSSPETIESSRRGVVSMTASACSEAPRARSIRPSSTTALNRYPSRRSSYSARRSPAASGSNRARSERITESTPIGASCGSEVDCRPHRPRSRMTLLEATSALRQLIDPGAGGRLQVAAQDHARLFEFAQSLGEDVRAHPRETGPKVGEALRAEQELANHEERPPLSDEVESAGDAAPVVVRASSGHALSLRARSTKQLSSSYSLTFSSTVVLHERRTR